MASENQSKVVSNNRSVKLSHPKREPLSRVWFLARGYKQADKRYTKGSVVWLHPRTNDALGAYGQKLNMRLLPYEKYLPNSTKYLVLDNRHGHMYLARLKYLTFIGPIPEGFVIDHIDGNSLNNDIRNLRAIPDAINRRDGGFMRKLRRNGIRVEMYPGIILEGYERMARWKESHSYYQYRNLKGVLLLQVFLGPKYKVDPSFDQMAYEMTHHCEI